MAEAVALRAALRNIGFHQDAATYVVDTQQFNKAKDYAMLTDEEATNICKITRRPGGLQPNNQPNPGISVSIKAENNLKLMCFYLRYRERTSRPLTANLVTSDTIQKYIGLSRYEHDHEDVSPPELTFKNWTRTIDVIEDYLRNCLGTTKIPLAYLIREAVDPPAHANDPTVGTADSKYSNFTEELIARAPHFSPEDPQNPGQFHNQTYKDDNVLLFNKLASLLRDKECWTYCQQATRTRDGRMAFLGLKNHYLGKNNVDNLANKAERQLQSASYSGEGRRWNFEKYVKTHVDQHQILQDLTAHGYSGIDPRSKVRYLMEGINTKELDHVKTRIMSDETLRSDFDACVNLFQDFIKQAHRGGVRLYGLATTSSSGHIRNTKTSSTSPRRHIDPLYSL